MRYFRRYSNQGEIDYRGTPGKVIHRDALNPQGVIPQVSATIHLRSGTPDDPHEFDSLFADHTLRSAAPAVAALVLGDVHRGYPHSKRHIIPSHSLSQWSSPLVQQVQRMGLVLPNPKNPEAQQTNYVASHYPKDEFRDEMTPDAFESMQYQAKHGLGQWQDPNSISATANALGWFPWQEVHPADVSQARSLVRQVLSSTPRSERRQAVTEKGRGWVRATPLSNDSPGSPLPPPPWDAVPHVYGGQ